MIHSMDQIYIYQNIISISVPNFGGVNEVLEIINNAISFINVQKLLANRNVKDERNKLQRKRYYKKRLRIHQQYFNSTT